MRLIARSRACRWAARRGYSRPFLPFLRQRARPWTDFVVTVNEAPTAPGYTRVRLDPARCTDAQRARVRNFLFGYVGSGAKVQQLADIVRGASRRRRCYDC
jgi:hypothetical protein